MLHIIRNSVLNIVFVEAKQKLRKTPHQKRTIELKKKKKEKEISS